MKKILLILNESHIPHHVIDRAIAIAKETNSFLEAIFLNDVNALNFSYPFPNDMYLTSENVSSEPGSEEGMQLLQRVARQFRDECKNKGVGFKVEIEKKISISHLITLSRFADIIITDSRPDSDGYDLKDILLDAHCPLLLIPRLGAIPEKIFLAYDGHASSMYAIKMFSYLFPEYKNLPAQLFTVVSQTLAHVPHVEEIKTWASKHFMNLDLKILSGNTKKEIVDNIRNNSEKSIIVMGAYGGSAMGRLFLKSTSESVINETNASLFITHE